MNCCILDAKPLLYNSFIAHPFHWVVGTFQFTRFERAMVVAFPFPTIFGCELPTSGGCGQNLGPNKATGGSACTLMSNE